MVGLYPIVGHLRIEYAGTNHKKIFLYLARPEFIGNLDFLIKPLKLNSLSESDRGRPVNHFASNLLNVDLSEHAGIRLFAQNEPDIDKETHQERCNNREDADTKTPRGVEWGS